MAVGIVTTLYTLVTMVYYLVCPLGDLADPARADLAVVIHFVQKVSRKLLALFSTNNSSLQWVHSFYIGCLP